MANCKLRKIAIVPLNSNDKVLVSTAQDMVTWLNNYSSGAKNYSTFVYMPSQEVFISNITAKDYSLSTSNSTLFSLAVVLNKAYPNWDYTLRLNQTYRNRT